MSGIAVKMSPWLKNHSDTENESSATRSSVADGEQPAPVGEPEQEDRAQTEPHRVAVDLLAAERALVPAAHLPRDLRPGPRLGHGAGAVVDAAGGDLTGLPRPDVDRPDALHERRVGDGLRRVALQPVRDLVVREEERDRLALRRARLRLRESRRLGRRDRVRDGRRRAGLRHRDERERECGDGREPHLRKDQSLLPRKFSGVTRMIATA